MKTILQICLVWLMLFNTAQNVMAQQTLFTKVIYDPAWNHYVQAYSVVRTFDHSYIVAGQMNDKALAMKLDSTGSVVWSKAVGSTDGAFNAVTATNDSCVVFAGIAYNSYEGIDSLFCVKMNPNGDTIWTRTIPHGGFYSVKQTYG